MSKKTNGHGAKIHVYRSYRFGLKDPIIDKCRTLIQDEGIKEQHAALISDLSPATLYNWFHGDTRKPQFASIAALTRSLGYEIDFKKSKNKTINVDDELAAAADHRDKMKKNPVQRVLDQYEWR